MDQHDAEEMRRLLCQARRGCRASLGQLFDSMRKALLVAARRDLPDALQAKLGPSDIVQETAVDAHRGFSSFGGATVEELYAWLRAMLRNNVTDAVRRYESADKRSVARETSLASIGDAECLHGPSTTYSTPERSVIRRENAALLADVLHHLPEDYQTVLRMRYWDGLTFTQIGARIGRSAEAARKLWYRAVVMLQAELNASATPDIARPDEASDAHRLVRT